MALAFSDPVAGLPICPHSVFRKMYFRWIQYPDTYCSFPFGVDIISTDFEELRTAYIESDIEPLVQAELCAPYSAIAPYDKMASPGMPVFELFIDIDPAWIIGDHRAQEFLDLTAQYVEGIGLTPEGRARVLTQWRAQIVWMTNAMFLRCLAGNFLNIFCLDNRGRPVIEEE